MNTAIRREKVAAADSRYRVLEGAFTSIRQAMMAVPRLREAETPRADLLFT